jgi:hypothetical protein
VQSDYYTCLLENCADVTQSSMLSEKFKTQIMKDVPRTMADRSQFRQTMESGTNPLYNVLLAYSKHNPDVGYCQGMNYLAGLILIGVEM